ncbi:hypothetical protein GE09DRAFT_623105 [Coniochaeta sp. 2T2.1]|nr:hypothetical protein GE09DRAFT_623105 [Coniochaeta sp. 2T2.1]
MAGRVRPDEESNDEYYTQYDHGRRHRSQPPKKNRVREGDRPQRPKFAKDDSYYNPRDKYYLSGDDEPDFHPYFASRKDDSVPRRRREESPPRHRRESHARYESPARYESRYESPTRYESPPRRRREASPPRRRRTSPSRDRRGTKSQTRSHSSDDRRLAQLYADEEQDRASRYAGAASTVGSSRHRSSTTVPPPRSDHSHDNDRDYDHRPSRRDTASSRHHYPPSSSKSHHPKRSSTQPASAHRNRTASRSSSTSKSTRSKRQQSQDMFGSAARAALAAGAMAASKLNDDPGPWVGAKGTKVITTALGAAMVDTFIEQRKPDMKGSMMHGVAKQVATFALGNLVTKPAAKHGLAGKHLQKGMKAS